MKNTKKSKQVKLPIKRTINLAAGLDKGPNWYLAVPGIIIVICAAAIFSKLCVVDRFSALTRAQNEVNELTEQVEMLKTIHSELTNISDEYAHYTFSGLSMEEGNYFNRYQIVEMIDKRIIPYSSVSNWSVKENVLSLNLSVATLEDVRKIVANLEQDELVSYCLVNSANYRIEKETNSEYVEAQITVYLNNWTGGVEE